MDDGTKNPHDQAHQNSLDLELQRRLNRVQQLKDKGYPHSIASNTAIFEERINSWPEAWGEDLVVLIYGDFHPPQNVVEFDSLGIIVYPDRLENTVIKSSSCVLKAKVKIHEKSVNALIDASKRVNALLGIWMATTWGNSSIGWWSYITHGSQSGAISHFTEDGLFVAVDSFTRLNEKVKGKISAALYWIREPKSPFREAHKDDLLRIYAGYWNAFECLVEAVNIVKPLEKLSKSKKQAYIDELVKSRGKKLSIADIQNCYREVVDPGFVRKAKNALLECFPDDRYQGLAKKYIYECFETPVEQDRLYQVRNDINHGNVDSENQSELIRIESRKSFLWVIVWQMLARFIAIPIPDYSSYDTMK